MAKLGFDYTVDVEATDKQGGGGVLPRMYARVWAEAIDFPDGKDAGSKQAALTFEVQEPEEFKGRKFWEYWTIIHPDDFKNKAYRYGKPHFDRFARAVQVMVDSETDSDELLFKTFVAKIDVEAGGVKNAATGEMYKDKNKIGHFYYTDDAAKEPTPEIGIIGDGTGTTAAKAAPVAANQNKPAAVAPASAKPAGAKPWGKKAA